MQAHGLFAQITFWFARNHVFVGNQNCDFLGSRFKHLPATCKRGFWAEHRGRVLVSCPANMLNKSGAASSVCSGCGKAL